MKDRSLHSCFPFLLIIWALPFFSGCVNDPFVLSGPDDDPFAAPEVGTLYTFDTYRLTPSGEQEPGILSIDRIWVVANRDTLQGRPDVVVYLKEKDYQVSFYQTLLSGDRQFFAQEIRLPYGPEISPNWLSYPFRTRENHSDVLFDSTCTLPDGRVKQFLVTRDVTWLGEEEKNISGEILTTGKFGEQIIMMLYENGRPTFTQVLEKVLWYSPSVGYFVQADSFLKAGQPDAPISLESTRSVLVRYNEPHVVR